METRKLEEIARSFMDCRPTDLGLLDLRQFGNVRPVEQRTKVEEKPKAKVESDQSAKPAAPRGFVTIEYEQDKKLDAEKKKEKKKNKKDEESSEESNSSEDKENDDFSDSDSDVSSDHGHRKRKPMKRKQQPTPASKGRQSSRKRSNF